MTVSIIIAVKTWQKNLEECVARCRELDYPDFEIIILPDDPMQGLSPKGTVPIQIIPTGPVSPAEKRDISLKHAKGEILAFIDDDAYPDKDWLKDAARHFMDSAVAAVGGPAVTPPEDSLRQKASGAIYSLPLVSGKFSYRYIPKKERVVEDYPSCNFLVRRSIMQELGGFQTNFWPGEDTKLCLDITHKLGKKIIYDPAIRVYHHRRMLFLPHLKQVANYALHRGYFVKKYPETSFKFSYFIPTLFLFILLGGGILSLFSTSLKLFYLFGISFYLVLTLIFSVSKNISLMFLVFTGIIFTHITYGIYFLKGLLSKKLTDEK